MPIHGNKSQNARVRALETLDISAEMRGRGWEIDVLERVYALDL